MEITQEQLHDMRKKIDACKQEVKKMVDSRPVNGGAEIMLSYRALQTAKHWLGEALGTMGSELPKEFADKAE